MHDFFEGELWLFHWFVLAIYLWITAQLAQEYHSDDLDITELFFQPCDSKLRL